MNRKRLLVLNLIMTLALGGCGMQASSDDNSDFGLSVEWINEAAKESNDEESDNEDSNNDSSDSGYSYEDAQSTDTGTENISNEDADFSEKEQKSGILNEPLDINLRDTDGNGKNYLFTYDGEDFTAVYTTDNWKIYDSYKITNTEDITIICEALKSEHEVHGSDMESFRTAEDMAYEWLQHNIAYQFLSDDSPWKGHAKNVDLDPKDQGKSFDEIYEDRTGKEFKLEDFLPSN